MPIRFSTPISGIPIFAVIALWAGLVASPAYAAPVKPDQRVTVTVPFTVARDHGGPLIEVRLNNKVTARFLLDTGAAECCISGRLVRQLGLHPTDLLPGGQPVYMGGDRGGDPSDIVSLDQVQIGQFSFGKSPFVVLKDDDFLRFDDEQVDGLIGGPLLSRFAMLIDFPRHDITLIYPGKLPPAQIAELGMESAAKAPLQKFSQSGFYGSAYYHFEQFEYLTKLTLTSDAGEATDTLWVDTGAPMTSITQAAAKRLALRGDVRDAAVTIAQSTFFRSARVPTVRAGDLKLSNVKVEYPEDATDIPPLLGEDVLSCCKALFDFGQHTLYLKPMLPPLAPSSGALDPQATDKSRLIAAAEAPRLPYSDALAAVETPDDDNGEFEIPLRILAIESKLKGDASDAVRYRRIAELYWQDDQPDKAMDAYRKETEVYRKEAALAPADATILGRLARALADSGEFVESEKLARGATLAAPLKPEVWQDLGWVLHARSVSTLTGRSRAVNWQDDDQREFMRLVSELEKSAPGKERIDLASELDKQALDCFDKAVAMAGDSVAPYEAHAEFLRSSGIAIHATLKALSGKFSAINAEVHTRAYLADREQIARLRSDDPEALADAAEAQIETLLARGTRGVDLRTGHFWRTIPDSTRNAVRHRMEQLDLLSRTAHPEKSAKALEMLGFLQWDIVEDFPLAEKTLRAALAKNGDRKRAAYLLSLIFSRDRRYEEMTTFFQERIAKKETGLDDLLLARAQDKLGHMAEAEAAAAKAVALHPQSFYANVTLAAMLAKNSEADPLKKLTAASDALDIAEKALPHNPDPAQRALYNNIRAIYWGLWGSPEDARTLTLKTLEDSPTNTQAREILAAVAL